MLFCFRFYFLLMKLREVSDDCEKREELIVSGRLEELRKKRTRRLEAEKEMPKATTTTTVVSHMSQILKGVVLK